MNLAATLEPTQDLEVYLGYSREAAQYADFADIRARLSSVAPMFDFDRAMTNPKAQVLSVRGDGNTVRGIAVIINNVMQLYYADDASATRALMVQIEEVTRARRAANS